MDIKQRKSARRAASSGLKWFAFFAALLVGAAYSSTFVFKSRAQTSPGIKTDRAVYPLPSPMPTPPAKGVPYTDPVFGTQILRVTDASDCPAPGCGTWYNQWPSFNADNTLVLIRKGVNGDAMLKEFDPETFELGDTVWSTAPMRPGNVTMEWQGATWSRTDPDLIYLHVNYYSPDYSDTGMKLYTYRVSTGALDLLKNFAPELAPGQPDFLFELHMDAQDDIFTFMHKRIGSGSEPIAFIVWKRTTDTVLAHVTNDFNANAALPDKTGRYVVFPIADTTLDEPRIKVLDLQTDTWSTIDWSEDDNPPTHGDAGTGTLLGRSPWGGGVNFRSLSSVHDWTSLFDMKDENDVTDLSNDQHMTLYADDESWVTLGTYDDPGEENGETGAFEDEIMQIATDGSQRIRRLCHTMTLFDDLTATTGYWASPKPTISQDGRFVAFTSNWNNSGRYDMYILKVPPADDTVRVNFQSETAPVPEGYLPDWGLAYGDRGNGHSYGWDDTNTAGARDRNSTASPDQRYDTLVASQYTYDATWEISMPNGAYTVHVVAGDPEYYDNSHNYRVNVEGVLTVDGVPSSTSRWKEGTRTVVVSDGRLTVTNASGSANNALNFIEITPAETIKVNFQSETADVPAGHLPDWGLAFGDRGNGHSYGWDDTNTAGARDRNSTASPDQRYDTLVLTQYTYDATWEIAVPNGSYSVHVVAGDPDYWETGRDYRVNVEGVLTVNGVPSSTSRWKEGTQTVTVSDGRLTITNASGSTGGALCFVEITPN